MNNHNPTDSHLIETISVKEFQQVLDSLQLARKVALDQVAYENAAIGVKSLKILHFSRCMTVQSVTELGLGLGLGSTILKGYSNVLSII